MEKIFKKSLALVLSAALCLTALVGCLTVSAADETTTTTVPTYTVNNATGNPGGEVTVSADLTNLTEVCAHFLTITFPKGFDVKEVKGPTKVASGDDWVPGFGTLQELTAESGGDYKKTKTETETVIAFCDIINFKGAANESDNVSNPSIHYEFVVDIDKSVEIAEYEVGIAVTAAEQENEKFIPGEEISKAAGKITVKADEPAHTYADAWSYDETEHWHACTVDGHTDVANKAAHEWNDGEITTEPTATASGVKTYTCTVCKATKTEEIPYKNITFGHTLQLKTIEPWGIYFNAIVRLSGKTIDYSTLKDYGVYVLRSDDVANDFEPTKVNVLTSEFSKKYDKSSSALSMIDNNTRIQLTYDESLYTYEMAKELFVMFYAEDEYGVMHYGDVKTRSMKSTIETYLNNSSSYNTETITLCEKMINMFEKTTAYREAHTGTSERNIVTPGKLGDYSFGANNNDVAYKFGHTMQLTTIEPWGITFNGIARLNKKAIDYSQCSDYGLIIYSDVNKKYSTAPTLQELLSETEASVYSKSNNGVVLGSNGFISVDYAEGIYTYQMDNNLYASFYVVIDGKYYYGDVKTRSMVSVMDQYFNAAAGSYGQDLLDLLTAMKELYVATSEYRALYN